MQILDPHYPQHSKQGDESGTTMSGLEKTTPSCPPPLYNSNPPDITAAFSNLCLGQSAGIPTIDECIAHLKLLEAFNQLRGDVGTTDGLYGIRDDFIDPNDYKTEKKYEEIRAAMREKRWAIYVTKAVERFQVYWRECIQADSEMLRQDDLDDPNVKGIVDGATPLTFTKDSLPPLG